MSDDWDAKPKGSVLRHLVRGLVMLWRITDFERRRLCIAGALLVVGSLLTIGVPLMLKELVDSLPGEKGVTVHALWLIAALLGLQLTILVLRRFAQEPVFVRAILHLENAWPCLAQEKLLALSTNYHERENTGRKISKVIAGVDKLVRMVGELYWDLIPALLFLIFNSIVLFIIDWRLGLVYMLPLIPAFWIHLKSFERFRPVWEEWEEHKDVSRGLFCQSILNVRTVQSFVAEPREEAQHYGIRAHMREIDVNVSIHIQRYFFAMEVVLDVAFASSILIGLYFVNQGWSTLGTVIYLAATGMSTGAHIWSIVQVYTRMVRDLIAAERLYELLHEKVEVANEGAGVIPQIREGILRFEDVTLLYPEKETPIFDHFNLEITPGKMTAFVGKSGSGKTSLVSLTLRSQDPTQGAVTIDGKDIRTVDRPWYRRRFAYVPQEVEIFDGSIRQNIAYSHPDADDALLQQAVEAACLAEALGDERRFPDGLETQVGERGVKLSGGERQRVGIARAYVAVLCGAQVLVLDEATSSLDSESERVVQQFFIEKLRGERAITIIAIAHRLSTIQQADRICVLENGRISEMGTHEQLLKRNGLYQKLVTLQQLGELSKGDLAE